MYPRIARRGPAGWATSSKNPAWSHTSELPDEPCEGCIRPVKYLPGTSGPPEPNQCSYGSGSNSSTPTGFTYRTIDVSGRVTGTFVRPTNHYYDRFRAVAEPRQVESVSHSSGVTEESSDLTVSRETSQNPTQNPIQGLSQELTQDRTVSLEYGSSAKQGRQGNPNEDLTENQRGNQNGDQSGNRTIESTTDQTVGTTHESTPTDSNDHVDLDSEIGFFSTELSTEFSTELSDTQETDGYQTITRDDSLDTCSLDRYFIEGSSGVARNPDDSNLGHIPIPLLVGTEGITLLSDRLGDPVHLPGNERHETLLTFDDFGPLVGPGTSGPGTSGPVESPSVIPGPSVHSHSAPQAEQPLASGQFIPYFGHELYLTSSSSTTLKGSEMILTVELPGFIDEPPIIYPFGSETHMRNYPSQELNLEWVSELGHQSGTVIGRFERNSNRVYHITLNQFYLRDNETLHEIVFEEIGLPIIFTYAGLLAI